jgi:hypothetical protein
MKKELFNKVKSLVGEQKFAELRKLLFEEDKPKEEEMEEKEEEEIKMAEAALEDGTLITWEGELAERTAIMVVTEEGNIPAPDAVHVLSDGTKVTTSGGVVTAIEAVVSEEVMQAVAGLKSEIETSVAQFKAQTKEIAKLKETNQLMFAAIETLIEKFEPKKDPKDTFGKGEFAAHSELSGRLLELTEKIKLKKK